MNMVYKFCNHLIKKAQNWKSFTVCEPQKAFFNNNGMMVFVNLCVKATDFRNMRLAKQVHS